MNPQELQRRLDIITKQLEDIRRGTDLQTYETIRRFVKDGLMPIGTVQSGSSGVARAVNESGAATYSVAKVPDSRLLVEVDGQNYFIPLYNA